MPRHREEKTIFPQFKGLGLSLEQQQFVLAYCRPDIGFNATRAYMEAFDIPENNYGTAAVNGCKLLKKSNISAAISIELERLCNDHKRLAAAVLQSWAATAFADALSVMEVSGPFVYLKSVEDIPDLMRINIQSIENTANGIKITLCSKDKARENIARALGLFAEDHRQPQGEAYESLVQRLAREEGQKG